MIRLVPRTDASRSWVWLSPLLAIFATLVFGALIFSALGYAPGDALYQYFISPFSRADRISDLMVKACPLIIIGVGLAFCYRANIWNIGAEGQYILGALTAGMVGLSFPGVESRWLLGLMMLAGMAGGAAWALLPAVLKIRFNTNEILTSLMLVYVASLLLDVMVRGPLRDPMSFGFPLTPIYPDGGLISRMPLPGIGYNGGYLGQLHYGVLIALIIAPLGWWLMHRTLPGFQVKVLGSAPRAARFAGFNSKLAVLAVLCFSGALAGLAGVVEVSANIQQLQPNVSFGYGFTAIIVAFLARLNPLAVILAGLVVAMAELGGDNAQIAMGIPKVVTGIFKGALLFFLLAGATMQHYRLVWQASSATSNRGSTGEEAA